MIAAALKKQAQDFKYRAAAGMFLQQTGIKISAERLAQITNRLQDPRVRLEIQNFQTLSERHADMARRKRQLAELEESIKRGSRTRAVGDLIRDGILTHREATPEPLRDKRVSALTKVLCSIPDSDYQRLKLMFQTGAVLLSIPNSNVAGCMSRVQKHVHCVLYLSPSLEQRDTAWVEYVCAHEAAHLLLHSSFKVNKATVETEADKRAASWGFKAP